MLTHPATGRAILCALALGTLTACHHRPVPTSAYAGAAEWTDEETPPTVERPSGRAREVSGDNSAPVEVRTTRIEDLFAGRYAGLDVQRTADGGLRMRLRGVEPLLIIDGMEADPVALVAVPARSVTRIEVLRNISETAIYGSRGVNGVVRVTTRR